LRRIHQRVPAAHRHHEGMAVAHGAAPHGVRGGVRGAVPAPAPHGVRCRARGPASHRGQLGAGNGAPCTRALARPLHRGHAGTLVRRGHPPHQRERAPVTIGESLAPFLAACRQAGIATDTIDPRPLAPAVVIRSRLDEWRPFAEAAKTAGMRWCAFWASETDAGFEAFSCLERGGTYVVLRCRFARDAALPSIAPVFAAADRPERHAHDLLGGLFSGQPDSRRWTRHKAWGENEFPLRSDYA